MQYLYCGRRGVFLKITSTAWVGGSALKWSKKGPALFCNSEKAIIGNIQYSSRSLCIPLLRRGNELYTRKMRNTIKTLPSVCCCITQSCSPKNSYQRSLALKSQGCDRRQKSRKPKNEVQYQGAVPWPSPEPCGTSFLLFSASFRGLPPSPSCAFQPSPNGGIQKYHLSNLHS